MIEDRLELCWTMLVNENLQSLISAAASAGFPAITVGPPKFGQFIESGGTVAEARTRLADAGVRVTCIDALVSGLPGGGSAASVAGRLTKYGRVFDYSEDDCYRIAEALGADSLNIVHHAGSPVLVAQLVDALGAIQARADRHGLRTSIEFVPGSGVPDLATAAHLVSEIGAPNFGVTVDTCHLSRSGGGPADLGALPTGMVCVVQIADRADPPGASVATIDDGSGRLLPGEGTLPLGEIVDILAREDPPVMFGVEVISEEMERLDPFEVARRGAAAMRTLLHSIAD